MKEIKDTIYNSIKRIQEATPDHLIGLSTGYERLDEVLGGLVEGTLVTIGGRTGMGKTAFQYFNLKAEAENVCFFGDDMNIAPKESDIEYANQETAAYLKSNYNV